MNKYINAFSRYWILLTGDPNEDTLEYRAFNSANILSMIAIAISIPINYLLGLRMLSLGLFAILLMLMYLYYITRFRQQAKIAIILFTLVGYVLLIFNFYWNSGVNGPTPFIFFMIFHLIVIISPQKYNRVWLLLHVLVGSGLFMAQYMWPEWIKYSYSSASDRYLDINFTFVMLLVFIYFLADFTRRNYHEEKDKVKAQYITIQAKNEELELINAERNRLFSIISHDLRSPLNSIQGYLEMLAGYPLERETRAEIEQQLLDLTKHTSSMLYNLLSWSSAQLDGSRMQIRRMPVLESVKPALELQKAMALTKNIELNYDIDPSMQIMADPAMLELVVRNLLSNAIKFTPPGGHVSIYAVRDKSMVTLTIRDSGVGIPEAQALLIFSSAIKPTPGTEEEKGLGLGLMLCRDFMELQHGEIWFNSVPGEGTEFYVRLPAAGAS